MSSNQTTISINVGQSVYVEDSSRNCILRGDISTVLDKDGCAHIFIKSPSPDCVRSLVDAINHWYEENKNTKTESNRKLIESILLFKTTAGRKAAIGND